MHTLMDRPAVAAPAGAGLGLARALLRTRELPLGGSGMSADYPGARSLCRTSHSRARGWCGASVSAYYSVVPTSTLEHPPAGGG